MGAAGTQKKNRSWYTNFEARAQKNAWTILRGGLRQNNKVYVYAYNKIFEGTGGASGDLFCDTIDIFKYYRRNEMDLRKLNVPRYVLTCNSERSSAGGAETDVKEGASRAALSEICQSKHLMVHGEALQPDAEKENEMKRHLREERCCVWSSRVT